MNLLPAQIDNFLKCLQKTSRIKILFWFLAILSAALTFVGVIKNYSPVPLGDMWDGYLNFFVKISDGDFSSLWAQHNEHRIVLSKILFWLDIRFFDGSGIFLITLNCLLPIAASAIFFCYIDEILKNADSTFAANVIKSLVLILLFSWTQKENFNWAFQSQFFLAQLLPLLSFFLLHKSQQSKNHSTVLFLLSCLTAISCAGTMANGVLALPIMALSSIILRMNIKRIATLIALSILVIIAYFYGYSSPQGHGSLSNAILEDPLKLIQYILAYLGNPVHHIGYLVAQIFGFIFLLTSSLYALKQLKNKKIHSLQLSLIAFILYIGITAAATGGGRLIFGFEQAFSSRYATPVLMAYTAFLIICSSNISDGLKKNFRPVVLLLLLIPMIFLPKQFRIFRSNENSFNLKIAALALEIGAKDEEQLKEIYPNIDHLISIAQAPIEKNLSIFGDPAIKDVRQLIGSKELTNFAIKCVGNIEKIASINAEEKYLKIEGWIFDNESNSVSKTVHITDENGIIVGYALVGKKRSDIKKYHNFKNEFLGFEGYLLKNFSDKKLIINGFQPNCLVK